MFDWVLNTSLIIQGFFLLLPIDTTYLNLSRIFHGINILFQYLKKKLSQVEIFSLGEIELCCKTFFQLNYVGKERR